MHSSLQRYVAVVTLLILAYSPVHCPANANVIFFLFKAKLGPYHADKSKNPELEMNH